MNFSDPFNFAIADHYERVGCAIEYLIDLQHDDIDICDKEIFNSVMKKYQLDDDGFESERDYILTEALRRI
jgi:hypothetical protein